MLIIRKTLFSRKSFLSTQTIFPSVSSQKKNKNGLDPFQEQRMLFCFVEYLFKSSKPFDPYTYIYMNAELIV